MRQTGYLLGVLFFVLSVTAHAGIPSGVWLTSRKDPRNQARADVAGKMTSAPHEVWRISTGGDVGFVRPVRVGGQDAALVLAGTTLQLLRWSGEPVWRDLTSGVTLVMHIGDFDGSGGQEVMVRTDARTVILLDLASGKRLWAWQSEPSTNILGTVFYRTPTGIRVITFPQYSVNGCCFDFSGFRREGRQRPPGSADREAVEGLPCVGSGKPTILWQKNYGNRYGAGYGPSIVLKDMDGDRKLDIALSAKVPSVYQAVLDIDTGEVKFDAHYSVENEWGRPYGLLKPADLDGDGFPDFVMVSCQVEEYIAVARGVAGKGIEKIWHKFVEKDWPEDHKELRPQVTSLADLQGTGKVELVVGLWENDAWHTLIIDPLKGFESRRGELRGYYFWGCYDVTGDGRPELVVSREKTRRPARCTTLLILDGRTFRRLATLSDSSILASGDSALPDDTAFMALRSNPVYFRTADGRSGILVRRFRSGRETGLSFWGGKQIREYPIAGTVYARADVLDGSICLTEASGRVQRFDMNLQTVGRPLVVQGRASQPLVWSLGGTPQLVFDAAGSKVVGLEPVLDKAGMYAGRWELSGTMPALHLDSSGTARLSVADMSDPDHYAAIVYTMDAGAPNSPLRIPLAYPPYLGLTPYGARYRLLVNLQTGVHTMALACYDSSGALLWKDDVKGAHPRIPAAADLTGDGLDEVVADDHGVLRVYDPSGAVLAADPGWPPAYNLPILGPFGADGETLILRASGISGTSLIDSSDRKSWHVPCDIWRYYRSLGTVGDVSGDGRLKLGALAEDGLLECIGMADGKPTWSLPVGVPSSTSVVSGDLDGDGRDEFLLGLDDGRLICIEEEDGQGRVLWQKKLDAGVANTIIADLDGDRSAEIILSTSDGYIRVFR